MPIQRMRSTALDGLSQMPSPRSGATCSSRSLLHRRLVCDGQDPLHDCGIDTSSGKCVVSRQVHRFENGVRVFEDHLVPEQRKRHGIRNVHEIEEEDVFLRLIRSMPPEGCFVNIGSAIGYCQLLPLRRRHLPIETDRQRCDSLLRSWHGSSRRTKRANDRGEGPRDEARGAPDARARPKSNEG